MRVTAVKVAACAVTFRIAHSECDFKLEVLYAEMFFKRLQVSTRMGI